MPRFLFYIAICACLYTRPGTAGECPAPPSFSLDIPDGASASREAMLSAQRTLKTYDNAVMAYAACLRDAGLSLAPTQPADAELRQLAQRFNDQLKLFKERNTGS